MNAADRIMERKLTIDSLKVLAIWAERGVLDKRDYPRLAQVLNMAAELLKKDGETNDDRVDQVSE